MELVFTSKAKGKRLKHRTIDPAGESIIAVTALCKALLASRQASQ